MSEQKQDDSQLSQQPPAPQQINSWDEIRAKSAPAVFRQPPTPQQAEADSFQRWRAEQKSPQYVTCRCEHCEGPIEFDANELVKENSIVPCPHCGLQTKISIPDIQTEKAPTELPSSVASAKTVRREGFFCGEETIQETGTGASSEPISAQAAATLPNEPQTQIPIPEVKQNPIPTSNKEPPVLQKHKRVRFTKGTRIALTPAQCASPAGKELINLLNEIVHDGLNTDGLVTEDGIQRLNAWLDIKADSDIPAIKFLLQISDRILRAGKVTTAKAFEMHFAIERVLPTSLRDEFKKVRQDAWLHSPLKPKATEAQLEYIRNLGGTPLPGLNVAEASLLIEKLLEHSTPPSEQSATEKQIQYIRDLGENPRMGLSKADASMLIEQLQAQRHESFAKGEPPSPRQIMVLRFWNRMDLEQSSKWEIEQWQNQFYAEDPRRKVAWEAFKLEIGDDGSQHDPSCVPVGAGENYLSR
jgi:hypothetical protein